MSSPSGRPDGVASPAPNSFGGSSSFSQRPHSSSSSSNSRPNTGAEVHRKAKQMQEEKQNALSLYSHSGVQAMLTQKEGKMNLKAMRAAVGAHHARALATEEALKASTAAIGGGVGENFGLRVRAATHMYDHSEQADTDATFAGADEVSPSAAPSSAVASSSSDRQMREMIFLRSLGLYEAHERSLAINPTKHRLGAAVMTESQRDEIEAARENTLAERKALRRATERTQRTNHCSSARVVSMVGEASVALPSFVADSSESWAPRKRLLDAFRSSVAKAAVRGRVDRRLANVSAHATSRGRAKKLASSSAATTAATEDAANPLALPPGFDPLAHLQRDFLLMPHSVSRPGEERMPLGESRAPVLLSEVPRVHEGRRFDEVIPFDYSLLGYDAVSLPAVYVAPPRVLPRRTGAWEESQLRGIRGEAGIASAASAGTPAQSVAASSSHAATSSSPHPPTSSPLLSSLSLLDRAEVTSASAAAVHASKTKATKAAKADAAHSHGGSSARGTSPAKTAAPTRKADPSALALPAHLIAFSGVAQAHAVISAPLKQ